ncbi:MAG: AbrB/MazE/SpoVT family DNA-binding domain-containing protein [Methylothermaceae bacterium]|nr:AbrB/MazE/SpoVT family DNA-binding domain-containing protein [Methylothermaceae bacterium]
MSFVKLTKISSKGQITLPKAVRDLLQTDMVRIVVEDSEIRIEPAQEVGGSLKQYAKRYVPLEEAREKAWEQVIRDKYSRR